MNDRIDKLERIKGGDFGLWSFLAAFVVEAIFIRTVVVRVLRVRSIVVLGLILLLQIPSLLVASNTHESVTVTLPV